MTAELSGRAALILSKGLTAFFAVACTASIVGLGWIVYKFGTSPAAVLLTLSWAAIAGLVVWLISKRRFALVAAVVIAARVGVFLLTNGAIPESPDPNFYDSLARSLAHGRELPYVIDGVTFLAHAPRLHAYLLSIVFFVTGGSSLGPIIANGLTDFATAAVLYKAAELAGRDARQGALVAAAYLLWPNVLLNSVFAQKESLACLLFAACVFAIVRAGRDSRPHGISFGIPLGLLAFTQPAFFLLAAGLQLALLRRLTNKDFARMIAVSTVVATAVLVPWIVRNWVLLGGFVPLTTGAGMSMYVNAAGTYNFPDQFNALPEHVWSRQMLSAGLQVIAANPLAYAVHQIKMMGLGFALQHDTYMVWSTMRPLPRIAAEDTTILTQSSLVVLWALAAWLARKQRAQTLLVLLVALSILYVGTIAIWFEFGARHRAYFLPLILLGVAVTKWDFKTAISASTRAPRRNIA